MLLTFRQPFQRLRFLLLFVLVIGIAGISGCFPTAPPYPYQNPAQVTAEAQQLSARLEQYIKDWMDGKADASIPNNLIPNGIDPGIQRLYLQRPEEIDPQKQWLIRRAETINLQALHGYFPDPNCTYLKLGVFYAPFGSRVIIEGQFPHSRFFDIQASPSFNPRVYYYDKSFGAGEVPLVDADINPLPRQVNPFRVGTNRSATNRNYLVTLDLAVGNAAELNPVFQPPYYRAPGNNRVAAAIAYQGPWGANRRHGHGRGVWDTGDLWLRYYAIDKNKNVLGGVPFPKVTYALPDGRRYYINADFSQLQARVSRTIRARRTWPMEPPVFWQSAAGWDKQFGIFLNITTGLARVLNVNDKQYIRNLDRGVTGRGEDQPPPGNFEPSTSTCTYINYLLRGMALGSNKIAVLTGKLPTFPDTRNGANTMRAAQMRYWSITGYDANIDPNQPVPGAAVTSVMDDQIILDRNRRYVIVYSRQDDRPANANPAAGVTWVNWGPTASHVWSLRWMSIAPQWNMAIAPNEANLPWTKSTWSGKSYDPNLIGRNNHQGVLGEYLPKVHYMTKREFEALGRSVNANNVPVWR
jgi:hypothetical protein